SVKRLLNIGTAMPSPFSKAVFSKEYIMRELYSRYTLKLSGETEGAESVITYALSVLYVFTALILVPPFTVFSVSPCNNRLLKSGLFLSKFMFLSSKFSFLLTNAIPLARETLLKAKECAILSHPTNI